MRIEITVECETIIEFQAHLLRLFEQTVIYCHENKHIDTGEGEFPPNDVEKIENQLSDANCYGSHVVLITYPE